MTDLVHAPLPYVARIRVMASDDAPADVREVHVVAYSVLEAMMQISMQVVGTPGLDEARVKFESIAPDLKAYVKMMLELQAAKDAATKESP